MSCNNAHTGECMIIASTPFSSLNDHTTSANMDNLPLCSVHSNSYIYKYKNEVGCRDDTVPKTVNTRRHCEEE